MKKEQYIEILTKHLDGKATAAEENFLFAYYNLFMADADVIEILSEDEKLKLKLSIKANIDSSIDQPDVVPVVLEESPVKRQALWPRIAAAAAILLVVGLGVFFYTSRHPEFISGSPTYANDIKPGSNKAYLILSNGKRLSLNDAANGAIAKEAGVEISKAADGQVVYTVPGDPGLRPRSATGQASDERALNTIETPRGGQYQIRLPDGSKVWLNAASKLIYPVSFNGRGQRIVELSGEAYFEIFKNKLQPFVVKSKNQEVTVLGTHFNVNSYVDEASIKTTLLEGSVKVNDAVLKPGEQATLTNNQIKVTQVNTELAVAWKNNQFMFESEPIENVMRMIARWYNVDIIYSGEIPTSKFGGAVSRFDNVSEVLKSLESTGKVHFRIEGQKIYVTK